MLKACSRCGKVHKWDECQMPAPIIYKKKDTYQSSFRSSGPWKRKRSEILQRDAFVCRLCLSRGRLTGEDLEVHHIIPIKTDRRLELADSNLITVCARCHEEVEGNDNYIEVLRELVRSPLSVFRI